MRGAPSLRRSVKPNVKPDVNVNVKTKTKAKAKPDAPDVKAKPDAPDAKKPVSKTALAGGAAGVVAAGVSVAALVGADQKRRCVDEWRAGYPEHWEGEEKRTLEELLKKTKAGGNAEALAKYQKAYYALYDCNKHDVVGNGIDAIGSSVLDPIGGLAGDVVAKFLGPIANALEPVRWVLVALLCALAVGAAYKAYTVLLARRAISTLEAPPAVFGAPEPWRSETLN